MSDGSEVGGEDCPGLDVLQRCFDGGHEDPQNAAVHEHVDGCELCREFMAAMARFELGADVSPAQVAEGDLVGRYTVGAKLGTGAMGVVYEAYDRVLHRRVALKFLSRSVVSGRSEQARVFAEARAMARLSHQNVAQVYEATEVEGRAFIAMELVAGETLARWLESDPHASWRALVGVFAQAARGLAAAHSEGVVHGDFKPENVLLSEKRVPKIVDFGLAGVAETRADIQRGSTADAPGRALTGTPLYLSPEVWAGQAANAQSDQFAFCVSLFRALFGQQPFPGTTVPELQANVTAGDIDIPRRGTRAPARLLRTLLRGLHADPVQRWPSMEELAEALENSRKAHARRQRWVAGAAIAVVSGTAGALAVPDDVTCPTPRDFAEQVWGEEQRGEVVERLQPSLGHDGAAAIAGLDGYVERWAAARAEACGRMQANPSDPASARLDPVLSCLSDAQRAIEAAVAVLGTVPAAELTDSVGVLATLPDLSWCPNADLQDGRQLPDVDGGGAVREARDELAKARALRGVGLLDECNQAIRAAADTLTDVDEGHPIWDEYRIVRGLARFEAAQYEAAVEDLRRAFRSAVRSGRDGVASKSSRSLAFVLAATDTERLDEARVYARVSQDIASRRGDVANVLAAESRLSAIELSAGAYDRALEHAEAALAMQQSREVSGPLLTATLLMDRAVALGYLGRLQEAASSYQEALSLTRETVGPEHLRVALARMGLATALGAQGDFDAALVELRASRQTFAETLGPAHRHTVDASHNIGVSLLGQRHFAEAEREFRALLALPSLPGSAADTLRVHRNLGATLVGLGLVAEAARDIESALEAAELEPDDADVLASREVIAGALAAAGEFERSATIYGELVAHWKERVSANHPSLLRIRVEHEALMWRTGRTPAARVEAELREIRDEARGQLGAAHGVPLRSQLLLAELAGAQGRVDDAESLYREAIDSANPDSALYEEALVVFARYLFGLSRHSEVVEILTDKRVAQARGGTHAEGLGLRGYALWELGEDRAAARALVQDAAAHCELRPGSFPLLAERAAAWLQMHRL